LMLEVTEEARQFIAEQGFDPVYGARPLRRFIARDVETRIARALIGGVVEDGAEMRVDLVDGEIVVKVGEPAVLTPEGVS